MVGRRAGRKRKSGERYPSGQIKPTEKLPDDMIRAGRQPHRRPLDPDDRLSEKAESALGRMLLAGQLNDPTIKPTKRAPEPSDVARARFQAGELYAQVVGVYRAQLGGPRLGSMQIATAADSLPADGEEEVRNAGCPSAAADPIERQIRIGGQVVTVREWPCQAAGEGCACARRKARYDGAFEALGEAGRRALLAVNRVAVHGEAITAQDVVYLDRGLDALRDHFGLTNRRRREHY